MNESDAIFDLLRWDEQESFYRSWHLANEAGRIALLANDEIPQEYKSNVTNPQDIDPLKTEERFFATGRNVQVVKHPRYLPFFCHSHRFFEMLCVVSGTCRQVLEGREQTLSAGDVCLIAPDVNHGIEVMDDSLVINVLMRSSTFLDIFQSAVRDKGVMATFFLGGVFGRRTSGALTFHTQDSDIMRNAVVEMYAEQQEADEVSDRIVCSLLTIFLARLTRQFGPAAIPPGDAPKLNERGAELLAYVLEHASTVTLASLAEHFHYSTPYCSKLVREACNLSFSDLVTQARVQRAMAMLTSTQLSVAQIGYQVGYKNPETFIRAFERTTRMTPSQYRRSEAV